MQLGNAPFFCVFRGMEQCSGGISCREAVQHIPDRQAAESRFFSGEGGEPIPFRKKRSILRFADIETVEKAAQIYMLTAHLPRINTIKDEEMVTLAEFFGVKYRRDFLNL